MGNVALGGSFSGLDWWSTSSPFASTSTSQPSFSSDGDTVFVQNPDGSYKALGASNTGGKVNTICWSNSSISDTSSNGTLYIGGSFSSIGSVSSTNVIAYSISTSTFHALSSGLSGSVNTLYCDNSHGQVWAGGLFNAPTGSGGNVAVWSTSSSAWMSPSFGGLNGVVKDINPSLDGNSLYFTGGFSTTYISNSTTLPNSSISNTTFTPSAPANTSTVGNSGYLTPVTLPSSAISTGDLRITAGHTTSQSQYSDPNVLLCPGSGVWLAQDNSNAQIEIQGNAYLMATGARVGNSLVEGRGTTTFWLASSLSKKIKLTVAV